MQIRKKVRYDFCVFNSLKANSTIGLVCPSREGFILVTHFLSFKTAECDLSNSLKSVTLAAAMSKYFRIGIRIFYGPEKGTCAPNNHEQAFVQREETED